MSKGNTVQFPPDTTIVASSFHVFISHMSGVNLCISVWALMQNQPPPSPKLNDSAGAGVNFRITRQGKAYTKKSDVIPAHLKTIHKGCIQR